MTTAEVVQKIRETAACCANTNTAWLPAIADLLEAKDAECKAWRAELQRFVHSKQIHPLFMNPSEARRRCDELEKP
jgi:hypothetical protein